MRGSDVTEPATQLVGVVSPGEMGAALGAALARGGAQVLVTTAGRSPRTAGLAAAAGLELVADLDEVVRRAPVLLSVVPPQHARAVADDLVGRAGRLGVRPLLADLNAVSPAEVADIAARAVAAGIDVVDGAVSGAPPVSGRPDARVLLSGPAAARVAALPWTSVVVQVVGTAVGAASAAKMCTGAVRKGVTALVINSLLTAAENGVLDEVEAELRRVLRRDPLAEAGLAASKAWRFVPEMEAVAETQRAAGLDPATYRAIADIYRRTARGSLAERRPEGVDRDALDDPGGRSARAAAVVAGLRARPRGDEGEGPR
ncbi:NAD(P)-dependent oxidoreductase [Modestobacter marinus]|uniref:6-phosphogluconate dehydrogenase n=1 Tax=Modestobacter marinus TaxID=477641 RepID=A0ABQ2FTH6_9ACTN|nr:6-phosphogluconate dehydrogenase [Modestobacter marinus]